MLYSVRTYLVVSLSFAVFACSAQSNVLVKRLLPYKRYQNYKETHLIDVFNVGFEYELNQQYSIGGELFYSNYKPVLADAYNNMEWGTSHFFDRSVGIGIFARRYFGQSSMRLFLQPGVQLSYIHIRQPVLIPSNYKINTRLINNKEWIPSGTLAVGGSFGGGRVLFEPYLQVGVGKVVSETRGNSTLIAALGRQSTGEMLSWLLVPIGLKWSLGSGK